MRKIFMGIAIELFAVLLQLSFKETAVSLIIGALGLLVALLVCSEPSKTDRQRNKYCF